MIYDAVYKTSYGAKPLRIVFDKVVGYIRKYDKTRYLAIFHSNEKHERIFDRIRYLIMFKSNISDIYLIYSEIETNSDNLPLEKIISMNNLIIFIKFNFNENHNHYYYKVFLEKYSYK